MTDEEIAALIAENEALRAQLGGGDPDGAPVIVEHADPAEIDATGDAAVQIIEAQAAADVRREHAHAETQVELIEAQTKADAIAAGAKVDEKGDIVDDTLAPESTHPYFRKMGGRK